MEVIAEDMRRKEFTTKIGKEKTRMEAWLPETVNPASRKNTSYPLLPDEKR